MYYVSLSKEYIRWRHNNLSRTARDIEEALWFYVKLSNGSSVVSQDKLRKLLGVSIRTVQRGCKELHKHRIVKTTARHSGNQYLFLNFLNKKFVVPNPLLTEAEIDTIIENWLRKGGK